MVNTDNGLKLADEVLSRQALHDLNALYCRAIDRCDPVLLASLFHDDAIVDFGAPMPIAEWIPFIIEVELSLARRFHSVANEWFEFRGDKALCERYLYSMITQDMDGVSTESLLGARYMGGYERRDGVWKFTLHAFLMDWNVNFPTDPFWDAAIYAAAKENGRNTPDDPVELLPFANNLPVIAGGDDPALTQLADKQAIDQIIALHSRGLDNSDTALIQACYHPDGIVEYGMFEGAASEFAEAVTRDRGGPATMHRPSATWSVINGDAAKAETTVIVYRDDAAEDGTPVQQFVCGRYLDTLEKRGGVWKLAKRVYVLDWNANLPDTSAWDNPLYVEVPRGLKSPNDKFHQMLADFARGAGAAPALSDGATEGLSAHALDKQALRELSLAYCRAMDRGDEALLASLFTGSAGQSANSPGLIRSLHSISTDYYEIDGDTALGETYVIRLETVDGDSGARDVHQGGRFLDRFERASGTWKFAERRYVIDWALSHPDSGIWDGGIYAQLPLRGTRDRGDPVYDFWAN